MTDMITYFITTFVTNIVSFLKSNFLIGNNPLLYIIIAFMLISMVIRSFLHVSR